MEILYVEFNGPINAGGDYGAMTSWSKTRDAGHIECQEKGGWIVLSILDGHFAGERRRIPMTSVNYIREREAAVKVEPAQVKK